MMQMRKTNHSYKSNKSNAPNKKINKGSKNDMFNNGGFSALNESDGDMNDDENDSNEEIDEQSPNEDQLDEEDNFIDNKKVLTPTGVAIIICTKTSLEKSKILHSEIITNEKKDKITTIIHKREIQVQETIQTSTGHLAKTTIKTVTLMIGTMRAKMKVNSRKNKKVKKNRLRKARMKNLRTKNHQINRKTQIQWKKMTANNLI